LFTGIIEEIGIIRSRGRASQTAMLVVTAEKIPATLQVGDSIAVNGVCLTATERGEKSFVCDLSAETLKRTSLASAGPGTPVNLERPMAADGRFGGHFVLGHVDGVARLISAVADGDGSVMSFQYPPELARYLVCKGSVTVDGISLTIAALDQHSFAVAVIPHTFRATNLGARRAGDEVNIEVDILGKYFERFFQLGLLQGHNSTLTLDYLKKQGF
jgi:riboflavin synthase